jgi:hypothetical protein
MAKASNSRKQKTPPAESRTEELREVAHARVDQLFDESTKGRFYGRIGLEVFFENGQAQRVRRTLEGTDK